MLKYLYILFLFLWTLECTAQYQKIDSLNFLLIEQSSDTLKIEVYLGLSRIYSHISLDSSMYYGQLSYDLSHKNSLKKQKVRALMSMGYVHLDKGSLLESIDLFSQGLELSEALKDTLLMAYTTNAIGLVNWRLKRNVKAVKNFQNTHDWAIQCKDGSLYDSALNNLGLISGDLGRHEEALKYFRKMLVSANEKNDIESKVISLLNIAVTHEEVKKYDEALKGLYQAITLSKPIDNPALTATIYSNIGTNLNAQKKYQQALDASERVIHICQKHGLNELILDGYAEKTTALLGLQQFNASINTAKEGIENSIAINYNFTIPEFYESLASAYEKKGDLTEALIWQKKTAILKDSFVKMDKQREVAQLEISFQTKQKDAENNLLKTEAKSQEVIVQQRTRIAIVTSLVVILLIVLALLLFLGRRKTKIMNIELEAKVKSRTEELDELNQKLMQSNEELQRFAFIASHDLKEPLRNVGGFISLIKKRIQQQDYKSLPEYISFVEKSNFQMVDLVDSVLEYSTLESKKNLEIKEVDLREEVKLIYTLLGKTMKDRNAQIYFDNLPIIQYSPFIIKLILKNIIENGIKYNKSESPIIRISYAIEEGFFKLIIKDNGIGIDSRFLEKVFEMFTRLNNRSEYTGSGMGLAFCKKALMNNGGDITVESNKGEGSTFIVSLKSEVVLEESAIYVN